MMASRYTCRTCLRVLRQHGAPQPQTTGQSYIPLHALTTSSHLRASPPKPTYPVPKPSGDPILDVNGPSKNIAIDTEALLGSPSVRLAKELRKRASAATETYFAYGVTERLFKECVRQADYTIPQALEKGGVAPKNEAGEDVGISVGEGGWYEELNLTPTFNTWAQITFLHMYALTTRLRRFPPTHAPAWHQHLLDHFFFDAENRMVQLHALSLSAVRQRYLKDLFIQWRGVLAAYDEGLTKGDAVLATAVWRNVFKAGEAEGEKLARVVGYVRREVSRLDGIADEDVAAGEVSFGGLGDVKMEDESLSTLEEKN